MDGLMKKEHVIKIYQSIKTIFHEIDSEMLDAIESFLIRQSCII